MYLILISFVMLPANTLAQEEDLFGSDGDSLLFGEEFDLGGDDFSFDFDDTDSDADSATVEDEFSFDLEDEVADSTVAAESTDTTATDEWGMESFSDYEDLITRTAEGDEKKSNRAETDHPLDFRKYVKGTPFENTGLTLSLFSPQYVSNDMDTWFSFLDFSLNAELPWHYEFDPIDLSFQVDISSFNFENSFPAGGTFRGASFMPIALARAYGAELELGLGLYYPTFGALMGLGYSYQFHSLFFSAGYRWNWVNNVAPIGSAWWLEPRFTFGVKLW